MTKPYPERKPMRLPTYDYNQAGAYFVTTCTQDRIELFGKISGYKLELTPAGEIVEACWHDLPNHYPQVTLDAFVVMPNHIHGIIWLHKNISTPDATAPDNDMTRHGLSEVIRDLKSFSSRRINEIQQIPGRIVWQRSFYDTIVRDNTSLARIRNYIQTNPIHWIEDQLHPDAPSNRFNSKYDIERRG